MRFHEAIHGVYFDDLDALQILHNARYVVLFERTIGSFWTRAIGWSGSLDDRNPDRFHLVRTNSIEYIKPVAGICEVRVRVWVEKLGRSSLTFGFRILPMDEDIDHARGTRVVVCVDRETYRPSPWSDGFREKIAPFINPTVGE